MHGGWVRYALLLAVVAVAGAWGLSQRPTHEERDVAQERLEEATPPLSPAYSIGQTFRCHHDGLKAVELLVALYNPEAKLPPSSRLFFTLQPLDPDDPTPPIQIEYMAAGLTHNQRLRFSFAPLPHSRGTTFLFTVRSDADHGIGFWYSASEAYAEGARRENDEDRAGDLLFATFYDYTAAQAIADALGLITRYAGLLPALALLLLLPGCTIWHLAKPSWKLDPGSTAAMIIALSLALWPLLLLWTTTLGLRLNALRLWAIIALLLLVNVHTAWRRRGFAPFAGQQWGGDVLAEVALVAILIVGWGTRLLQIRHLAVPAWVDSVHHTLITQLIVETGRVPDSLSPYLPIDGFHYHFGFHASAAALAWLTGLPTHRAVLLYGQALNTLAGLSAYALAIAWARRRWAGVGAALVVTVLSYMPAYYVSWGRYTQLAGLLLLPPAALASIEYLSAEEDRRRFLIIPALLIAGLGLTHYRVIVFYLLLWPLLLPWFLWRRRAVPAGWAHLARSTGMLALLAGLVILPWLARFVWRVFPQVGAMYGGLEAREGTDTSFSDVLLRVGWTPLLLRLAASGFIWGLVRRRAEILLLGLWVGLWLLVANLHLLGLPNIWLIHNQVVIISYWLPMGVLCGWLVADTTGVAAAGLARLFPTPFWGAARSWMLAVLTFGLLGIGAWRRVDAVNPVTVLTTAEDVQAMQWAADNLPADALVLINTGKWQGELRMGTDGGWWLPILAHRQVTLPCALYAQGSPRYREQINALARKVEEAPSVDDPALLEALQKAGVTHVFVGARGGKLMPQQLDASPHYRPLYILGPVRIYALNR